MKFAIRPDSCCPHSLVACLQPHRFPADCIAEHTVLLHKVNNINCVTDGTHVLLLMSVRLAATLSAACWHTLVSTRNHKCMPGSYQAHSNAHLSEQSGICSAMWQGLVVTDSPSRYSLGLCTCISTYQTPRNISRTQLLYELAAPVRCTSILHF